MVCSSVDNACTCRSLAVGEVLVVGEGATVTKSVTVATRARALVVTSGRRRSESDRIVAASTLFLWK